MTKWDEESVVAQIDPDPEVADLTQADLTKKNDPTQPRSKFFDPDQTLVLTDKKIPCL